MDLTKYGFSQPSLTVSSTDGRNFVLTEHIEYTSLSGVIYRLPQGAPSDGASTPEALWALPLCLTPFGKYWPAAYAHDCAYQDTLQIATPTGFIKASLTKEKCDSLLLEIMERLEVNQIIAHAIYQGVNVGGFIAFNDDRKKAKQ